MDEKGQLYRRHRMREMMGAPGNKTICGAERDYDALKAEQTLKQFCAFLREVISHYEENQHIQEEAEAQETDLRHAIELMEVTDEEQRLLYGRLSTALRTRRTCKNENMVLKPLYDQVADKNLLNRLSQVQGSIGTVKRTVADKAYACRTDVLDDFREGGLEENGADVGNTGAGRAGSAGEEDQQ